MKLFPFVRSKNCSVHSRNRPLSKPRNKDDKHMRKIVLTDLADQLDFYPNVLNFTLFRDDNHFTGDRLVALVNA